MFIIELLATKDDMYMLMDEQSEDRIFTIVNLLLASGLIIVFFLSQGKYPFSTAFLLLICLIHAGIAVRSYREKEVFLMDISDCYIRLNHGVLEIRQIAGGDAYETCLIFIKDIYRVVEETKVGNTGFYFYVKENPDAAMRTVCGEKNLFFVRGLGYSLEDFKKLYKCLLTELPKEAEVIATVDQLSWGVHEPTAFTRLFHRAPLYLAPIIVHGIIYLISIIMNGGILGGAV